MSAFVSLGPMSLFTIGIDPATRLMGVAVIDKDGKILGAAKVQASGSEADKRLASIYRQVRSLFDQVDLMAKEASGVVRVVLEDGIFPVMKPDRRITVTPRVIGAHGEVRGMVMCECWRRGWQVRKVAPISWKSKAMTKEERRMPKNVAYATYWGRRFRTKQKLTPDIVDAILIARWGAGVLTKR